MTGEPEKLRTKYDSHCNSIMRFPEILCSLPEVKDKSSLSEDTLGIREAFHEFIFYCKDYVWKKEEYKLLMEEPNWFEENL